MRSVLLALASLVLCVVTPMAQAGTVPTLDHPILFVAQVPIPYDFATIGSTFANHRAGMQQVGRGGDLYIRDPDGTLRNLTREAGYGVASEFQGAGAIAVRDPSMHWDGQRAVFSMVVGAPTEQYQVIDVYWQLYEITGLGPSDTPVITKVPNQPSDVHNISPVYSPDGRIVFTSDRPRGGPRSALPHLYPQLDEYESTPTVTGLWALDPATGDLDLLDHAPSGDFTPIVDSFGRIVFTRWDHLQRDQQGDSPSNPYEAFDWLDESADAPTAGPMELFPEPRIDPPPGVNSHRFNHFFPWMVDPDGRELETLNHIGRHELHAYFNRAFDDDPNLVEFIASVSGRVNPNEVFNVFQLKEDPTAPGTYVGVDAPEFQTHASGMVVRLALPPGAAVDQMIAEHVTHPDTAGTVADGDPVPATHSGHYRDPLPLADGRLLAAHTPEARPLANEGTTTAPISRYLFRLRLLEPAGAHQAAGADLTAGITRRVQYWSPDQLITYDGPLWELSPVEVRSRPTPPVPTRPLPAPEAQVLAEESVAPDDLRTFLREHELALVVSRDVTTRDALDRQQPFNLRVPGGTQTTGAGGVVYDVSSMQFVQADQVRGLGGADSPRAGRRPLARWMHDADGYNPAPAPAPGAVAIAADGSMAAMVPARRALSWQLLDPVGEPVVRERYWLTFQPGEIRVCASCHGLNSVDQAGQGVPQNQPEALRTLLRHWRATQQGLLFADDFESGDLGAWSP
ncbi:MAG: hypothetical protein AAGC60_28135 [Acidobacteriota bacterium]